MKHAHLHEDQLLAIADINRIAGLDDLEIPLWMVILADQGLYRICCAIDRGVGDFFHQVR